MKKKTLETLIALIGIIIIVLCLVFIKKAPHNPAPEPDASVDGNTVSPSMTITEENIAETNFKGTRSVVEGSSALALAAEKYIDDSVASFKADADESVPAMRAEFGPDSPTASYEIDITATDLKSSKTESVVIDQYVYTGGANGSSSYKVFTVSKASGEMLSLGDIVLPSQQGAFTAYVQKQLTAWRPEGSTESVVFPQDVASLTFDSFENWVFDGKGNLIIYFDKYAIGPGALGAIPFPLALSKISNFLAVNYQ